MTVLRATHLKVRGTFRFFVSSDSPGMNSWRLCRDGTQGRALNGHSQPEAGNDD
ncbi:hypothetical protein JW960_06415 [candidate division KSB1 bacterium]|nr:hypothetical protein [candidate division KSB1 bacterium]